MSDDCISEKDDILLNKNNFLTTLVWSGLLDSAKCGELARAIDLCIVKQEPCEDVVSRQAVIDTIESWLSCDDYNEAERHIMRAVQSVLYDSPSVTPQRKIGHWMITPFSVTGRHYQCSECRYIHTFTNFEYCPKCGCRMVEPQKRSEVQE